METHQNVSKENRNNGKSNVISTARLTHIFVKVCILLCVRESFTWKILLIYICFHLRSLFACQSFIRKCIRFFFCCSHSILFFFFFASSSSLSLSLSSCSESVFFLVVVIVLLRHNHLLLFNFVVFCNERTIFFVDVIYSGIAIFFHLLL